MIPVRHLQPSSINAYLGNLMDPFEAAAFEAALQKSYLLQKAVQFYQKKKTNYILKHQLPTPPNAQPHWPHVEALLQQLRTLDKNILPVTTANNHVRVNIKYLLIIILILLCCLLAFSLALKMLKYTLP